MVENAVTGESHLLDRLGLVTGTTTEQRTAPSTPAGTYQIVAYRTENGENSAVTSTYLP